MGITPKDTKTLVVELETPAPYFLQIVASSVFLPIHSNMEIKDPNWATCPEHFISNGPFKLKEWKFNQEMGFEKNSRYWKAKEVKLEHVFIDIIDREMAALHMYASGHFDLLGTPLPFQNVNIRRAFGMAIHRQALVTHTTQLNEELALSLIPPI